MCRTYPSNLYRLACALSVFLFLAVETDRALGPEISPATQSISKCSDSPTMCKTPVKYLGESAGCACFACEHGRKTQKILCTKNEADKRTFKLLLPKSRS